MSDNGSGTMSGRIVLVTGGTGGIGKATAAGVARLGARVGIVGRDRQRAEAAAADIRREADKSVVDVFVADMSSQAEVRRLAADVLDRYPRLDVLVNNVGGFWANRHSTADGLEHTFAVNHLAPFLLTNLLLDRLRASAPARVVTVSSGAHGQGRIDFDDLQAERNYQGGRAYSQSKLANVMFTYELARRLEVSGVTANVLHPGVVRTGFGAEDPGRLHWAPGPDRPAVHEDSGAGRDHTRVPRLVTRGRGRHRPVLRQRQANALGWALVRHRCRGALVERQLETGQAARGTTRRSGELVGRSCPASMASSVAPLFVRPVEEVEPVPFDAFRSPWLGLAKSGHLT